MTFPEVLARVDLHFASSAVSGAALAIPTEATNAAAVRKAVALSELTFMMLSPPILDVAPTVIRCLPSFI
jgi:hypothetical protein